MVQSYGELSSLCDCDSWKRPTRYSYNFGGIVLQFDSLTKHRRHCTFYNIGSNTIRAFSAHIPLRIGWLYTSVLRTSINYSLGGGNFGVTTQLRNIVPARYCPVSAEFMKLRISMMDNSLKRHHFQNASLLKACERSVMSLYMDNRASPSDRTENGDSSVQVRSTYFASYDYSKWTDVLGCFG